MLLLSLHQPSFQLAESLTQQPRHVSSFVYVLVIISACSGGALHGVAMALRKYYGKGHEQYWLQWRWWTGTIADAVAGLLIWPAMPFVPVAMLAPLIIVTQLGSSYLLGLFVFNEKFTVPHSVGLVLAVVGVIGVSMSTPHHTAAFSMDDFWTAWLTPRFLMANFIACALLLGSFTLGHRTTFWAIAAAVVEGVQYICSRTIVDSIVDFEFNFLMQPAVLAAFCIKGGCIPLILHFQQQGLESDLSSFAGIFLVSCTLFMCIYGTAFFGEEIQSSVTFIASSFFTLSGIWLLNQIEEAKASDDESNKPPIVAGSKSDEDSTFEGAEQSA